MRKAVLSGLLALAVGCAGCSKQSDPPLEQKVEGERAGEPQPTVPQGPRYEPQSYMAVDLASNAKGLETQVTLRFSRKAAFDFARYAPNAFEIEAVGMQGQLPLDQGMSAVTATLAQPAELNGTDIVVYGMDQGQAVELYRATIDQEGN